MDRKALFTLLVLGVLCAACAPSFVVNSEGDDGDANLSDGACATIINECTLRAAIQQANDNGNGAFITFENVGTISPTTALPALTGGAIKIRGAGTVTLDGNQPGDCSGFPGLEIFESDYNEIQGLTIVNFGTGIDIDGWGGDAKTNVIGPIVNSDPDLTKRNVIGGNCRGIYIHGPGAFGNSVVGNYIGTNADGSTANPNTYGGIFLVNGAHDNLIGTYSSTGISFVDPTEHAAYWKLDESSGNRADSIGANTLNDGNTVLSASGKIGFAADFEANSNEFLEIADNADLSTGDVDFTVSAWVKLESLPGSNMYIASRENSNTVREYDFVILPTGAPSFAIFDSGGVQRGRATWGSALSTGVWHHITGFHDSLNNMVGIAVDAGAPNTVPTTGTPADTAASFRLGARRNIEEMFFDGLIDEAGVWKRVLTSQEITSLYNDGNGLGFGVGNSERNVISGNVGPAIHLSNADENHISGNLIGTTADGLNPLGNGGGGIYMTSGSNSNVIGVNSSGEGAGNVISANSTAGVTIQTSNNNLVAGNTIGADLNGSMDLGNGGIGVFISSNASGNMVGTNGDGNFDDLEGNLISANHQGIYIKGPNNSVAGNKIGTTIDGNSALGNDQTGVYVWGDNNRVGTNGDGVSDSLEGNIIGSNGGFGVNLNSESDFNWVAGNIVGLSADGTIALGNVQGGIVLGGHDNLIGTNGDGVADDVEGNVVSANGAGMGGSAGIGIGGDDNVVAGNYVGTNLLGSAGLGNFQYGVSIGGNGNLIGTNGDGTADIAERNVISGSGWMGVLLSGGASNNQVSGNYIGTDAAGTAAISNVATYVAGVGAVHLQAGANANVIGTNGDGSGDAAERNVISGNARRGVAIEGQGTNNNTVAGNYIGTDATGTIALGNGQLGVEISNNASGNLIGTDGDGLSDDLEANVISANPGGGVVIIVASSNQIAGNFIGTDSTGTAPLGNGQEGIEINASNIGGTSGNSIGGTPEKGNVIAFNGGEGVELSGSGVYPTNSPILYNSIFSNNSLGVNLQPTDGFYGITLNDPGDADSGANSLMNFPVLDTALALSASITITGEIVDGLSNTNFQLQFFSVPECDQFAEHGEGQIFLGEINEMTNGSGDVSFLANFAQTVTPGHFVTATATFASNTSEFSACIEVAAGSQLSEDLEDPFETPLVIVPLRDLNCRYYCTTESDVADNLLEGIEYSPIGWDPDLGFFAFDGPTFGEICFAPPVSAGTELMTLKLNNDLITYDQLTLESVPLLACPAFSTPTPTIDVDEGDNTTETPLPTSVPPTPECSDGIDNDGDGLVDYTATGGGDPQCRNANDDDELNP